MLIDRFTTHLRRVETLAAAGIAPPKPWTELYARFTDYRQMELCAGERLVAAITNPGKSDDVVLLHALALAEQIGHDLPGIQARVDQRVAAAIESALAELYKPCAERNYQTAQARFDAAAQAFTEAASAVDVQADAADIVNAPDEQRAAWTAAEALAGQIDAALPVLTVAAQLAGIAVDAETGSLLAMCVDTTDLHRRALWAAWESQDARCGRWAALVKLGARIRAADLTDIAAYDRPRDIEYRLEPEPGAPRHLPHRRPRSRSAGIQAAGRTRAGDDPRPPPHGCEVGRRVRVAPVSDRCAAR
jgi:hypothetical protein